MPKTCGSCWHRWVDPALACLMARRWTVALCTAAFGVYFFGFAFDPKAYQYHFALYFFAGVCLDLYRRTWEVPPLYLLAASGAASLALHLMGASHVALVFLIPAFVVIIGTHSTPFIRRFGRYGDISYGIYIYAFPVQQTVLWMGGKDLPFAAGLAIASVVTVACAFLSWHLVEHPALRLKSRLPARFSLPHLLGRFVGK